jgi:flavin reductase (DIM6/NTAB) family NADH-FMN oxidoreductase RutF
VVPRPIALTSTLSVDGTRNIAPFSYFNIVSHDPPHVALGICKNPDGSKKDTLRNIEDTKEFVINIMSDWYVESANHCCGNFAPEEDELQRSGLMNPIPSQVVKPCRLAESAFHMVNMKSRFLFLEIIHVLCHIHSSYLCLYTMNIRNVSW